MPKDLSYVGLNEDVIIIQDDVEPSSAAKPKPAVSASLSIPPPSSQLALEDLLDPCPDVHALFQQYNRKHFNNRITHTYVEYSRRMKLCAGTCTFQAAGCRIALSEPLLKLRPTRDLRSTLLHEMIHAFLFLTENAKRDGPDGHGPLFMSHAERINMAEPEVNITPYHTFNDEVDLYRVHHWRCTECQRLVKRSMNRPPSSADPWWSSHSNNCKGTFLKIAGPCAKKTKKKRLPKLKVCAADPSSRSIPEKNGVIRTLRIDHMLRKAADGKKKRVLCPICNTQVGKGQLSAHLETCIPQDVFSQGKNVQIPQTEVSIVPHPSDNNKSTSQLAVPSRLTKKRRIAEIIEIPESPELIEIPESPTPLVSEPEPLHKFEPGTGLSRSRRRNDVDRIVDVEALASLALNPIGKTAEDIEKIFRPATAPTAMHVKKEGHVDMRSIFKPFLVSEEPTDWEEKAKLQLRNLLGPHPEGKPFSFYNAAKQLKVDQKQTFALMRQKSTTREQGDLNPLPRARELLGCSTAQPSIDQTSTEPLSNWSKVPEILSTDLRLKKEEHRDKNRENIQTHFGNEIGSTSVKSRNCPICERIVEQTELESHINKCLNETNIPSLLEDVEERNDVSLVHEGGSDESYKEHTNRVDAVCSTLPILGDTRGNQNGSVCPLCDIAILPEDLESHVALCMKSSGLLDVF